MWNKFFLIYCLLLMSFFGLKSEPVQSDDGSVYQLKWAEVPGAIAYLLEIKNSSGYLVTSEKVPNNFYNASNFLPGIYEHRVGVINKFGKVGSFSEWVSFEVVVSKVPALTKEVVIPVSKEEKTKTFILEGKDFIDPMGVYIVLGGNKILAKSVIVESTSRAKVVFEIDPKLDTGVYDLILENPRKKILNVKQRVVLSESKEKAERFANRQERILKKEIEEDYYETPYWSTFWRSSIVPGWGQKYIDGKNWKLYVYPVLGLGIVGAYVNSYQNFLSARSTYEDSILTSFLISENSDSQLIWFLNRNISEGYYNNAKQELNSIEAGAGVFGLFMLYNFVDSYFSARRNVAINQSPNGFPLGQENIRLNAKMDKSLLPEKQSISSTSSHWDSRYLLEFSLQF